MTDEKIDLKTEYDKLFKSNNELLNSIYYAESVQQGILPQERHLNKIFSDYFVIYQPQGIIGGDLFWVGQKGKTKYFAVGDCTGHGVSGAMLSVLALSFLNYLILGKDFKMMGEVLSELDKKWIETFNHDSDLVYSNDWLELGLCSFNEETRELQFAGAFNKLTIINNGKSSEILGNKFPIGGWQLEKSRVFTTHTLKLEEPTNIYLYSDGFKDQFGFLTQKKFSHRKFIELLQSLQGFSLREQKQIINNTLKNWKNKLEQTDDICVLGIKL